MVSYTDSYKDGKVSGTSGFSFVLKFTVDNDAGNTHNSFTVTEDPNEPEWVY